jgi:hypothetical protein
VKFIHFSANSWYIVATLLLNNNTLTHAKHRSEMTPNSHLRGQC